MLPGAFLNLNVLNHEVPTMRFERTLPPVAVSPAKAAVNGAFFVPEGSRALLIRNGIPEQYCPPGHHVLPPNRGKVEVRLLVPEENRQPVRAAPDHKALELAFEASLLFVDGALVGVLKTPRLPQEGELRAWEGFQPAREPHRLLTEPLRTCLAERLRSCLPSAGVCCGGRVSALPSV
jgi:hypothetical protein